MCMYIHLENNRLRNMGVGDRSFNRNKLYFCLRQHWIALLVYNTDRGQLSVHLYVQLKLQKPLQS